MLMIGTEELARRMYEAWRLQQDAINPLIDEFDEPGWRKLGRRNYWHMPRTKGRLKWDRLKTVEQDVWKNVAREVSACLADAMGAL